MLLVVNDLITGNTAPNKSAYQALKPWCHASGAFRWVIDDISPDTTVDGYNLRERTQAELDADPVYQAWQAEQQAQTDQTQAQTDFSTMPDWVLNGTLAQAENYIETNVTDLPSAKDVLKQIAKILILFRDYQRIKG